MHASFFSLVKQLLAFNLPLFFSADEALLKESNPQTTRLLMLVFPHGSQSLCCVLVVKEEGKFCTETLHPQSQ